MERIMRHKKILIVLLAFMVIGGCVLTKTIDNKRIDSHITEKNIVYTPNTLALKSYRDVISIDFFDYWIFKLNDKQRKEIEKDLTNEKWSKVNSLHIEILQRFLYEEKNFEAVIYNENCYICVYDALNNKIVTCSDNSVYDLLYQMYIFIYEPETGYYICIYKTR